jgi:hypothetical protein
MIEPSAVPANTHRVAHNRAMSRSTAAIGVLVLALLASNAWWAYRSIDRGLSYSYLEASYSTTSELLKQTVAVVNVGLDTRPTREQAIRAAQLGDPTNNAYEKEGYVWVGQLGMKFNAQGQLTKVQPRSEESGK